MQLEIYKKDDFYEDHISSQKEYYERENADAYFAEKLAEKDKEIERLKVEIERTCTETTKEDPLDRMLRQKIKENAELKAKLENVNELVKESKEWLYESQKMHKRCADNASKQIRRLKRALYKACANWARSERYTEATWHDDEHREELWADVQDKCLAMAEEYK